jgi:hypothetical protein
MILIAFSASNPLSKHEKSSGMHGKNILFLLDVSLSMLACDNTNSSRIDDAESLVEYILKNTNNANFALVCFAQYPTLLSPLSADKDAIALHFPFASLTKDVAQGTSINTALSFAYSYLNGKTNCAVILLSDGEQHNDKDIFYSESNAENNDNIRLYCISFGSESGSIIPLTAGNNTQNLKDSHGKDVITYSHPDFLKKIADNSNGLFFNSNKKDAAISVQNELKNLENHYSSDDSSASFSLSIISKYLIIASIFMLIIENVFTYFNKKQVI